ncbi:protein phosphatase 1 regulatory subunit 26-like [Sinocyclocheilus anshuiensis]|uniref:Protein phosphatase 1 regulatory subunit 26-like n=1 Tax=Sinocyclocheilus anshuiensis TaxID=1608454 RepID=A0A671RKD2_9TELE|nr:PREDICTED: protein phosphatase 1 regulatory subunit 26-like [Sinocyclocheilus anshuiensis]
MFLKTVPPVVAIHSEWRSNKSYSLPLFFNDSASDSDLASVSGTPIPQKIQMIIESLHSTQSSDMSENMQTEKAAHSSHEAGYKGQMRLMDTSARSRRTGADTKPQTARSDTGDDSDSDDSVDRGIEEAIQEYLKEKVDHKRKGDPMASSPPAPKLQRREPTVPDAAKQHTHSSSGKVLTASNHIQRALSGTQPLKKKVKKKKLSKENPFKKADTSKILPVKSLPPPRAKKGSSSSSEMDRSPPRLIIKEEEEWLDSSSDDGIEEEIQRFQQEKKEKQEGEKDALRSSQQREDSESSSDEGIEEAIRRFQEEKHKQKKKKSLLKPAQLVPAQRSKPAVASSECMSTQPLKVLSKKSKKKLTTKKSNLPTPLGVSHFLNKCTSQGSKVKGCAPPPSNSKQTHTEHQIHSSLKVNTAELMCAEAILDISKTVMPEVFESNLSIANRNLLQMPTFPTVAPSADKSDESSVDSEDGIEQEIRKFLEHKAKMNKELPTMTGAPPPASGDPTTSKEPKKKMKETQTNKAVRLSLSKKRKFKEEQSKLSRDGDLVLNIKEEPPGTPLNHSDSTRPELSTTPTVTSHSSSLTTMKISKPKQNSSPRKGMDSSVLEDKGSTYSMSSPKTAGSERNDSSDKSSSLDSDEDLDAAIKDLLKTKKKVKKKVRDMKARKSARPSEASSLDAMKKRKPFTDLKSIPPSQLVKSGILKGGKETLNIQTKNDKGHKSKAVKGKSEVQDIKQSKSPAQPDKVTGNGGIPKTQDVDIPSSSLHAEDDDSSVDSDDSIEQEIRRFLAERAKESSPLTANTKQKEEAVDSLTSPAECDVKLELQKILIETPVSASASTSRRLFKSEAQAESIGTPARSADAPAELNKGPVLTPGSSCIMGCRTTESQKFEISTPRDPKNGSSQTGKDTPTSHTIKPNSFTTPSVSSEMPRSSGHQHQNLFLMRPVNSSMSDVKELSPADGNDLAVSRQRVPSATRIPLKDVISSLCPSPISKPQISSCAVTTGDLSISAPRGGRTEGLYLHNRLKRDRHLSDRPHLSPATSHLCQPTPVLQPHQGCSIIQVQAAFPMPLAKTNHLQVSQIEPTESTACLGARQREGGSVSKEEKEQEDEEQKCVDETDVESDEERKDQKTKDRKTQPHNQ